MHVENPAHAALYERVFCKFAEGRAELRARGIANGSQQRREGRGYRPALRRVVGNAQGHQEAADVREAYSRSAVVDGVYSDFGNREAALGDVYVGGDHGDFHGLLKFLYVELRVLVEADDVERAEIARAEHGAEILGARVARLNHALVAESAPEIDDVVVVQAGLGIVPNGVCHLREHLVREVFAHHVGRILHPAGGVLRPVFVGEPEAALHGDGMVCILVRERLPVDEVVHRRTESLVDDKRGAQKHFCRNLLLRRAVGEFLLCQLPEPAYYVVLLQNHLGDFLLPELRLDEFKDIGVVGIHHDHSRGAARLAAGLYGARHLVPAPVERERPRSRPLPRDGLALAAD